MTGSTSPQTPNFRLLSLLALAMLVAAPLVYLAVTFFVRVYPSITEAEKSLVTNILLVVAVAALALLPLVERIQVKAWRSRKTPGLNAAPLFFTQSITRIASVEAAYVLGLVVYLLTGEPMRMYYFYVVGIAWSLVYWPRPGGYHSLVAKLEKP